MDTKQVNEVILRGNILNTIIHEELYKSLRGLAGEQYKIHENAFFDNEWILFSYNNEKGYFNSKTQIAVAVQNKYNGKHKDAYFGTTAIQPDFKTAEVLFKTLPPEIVKSINSSKTYDECHWVGVRDGSYCIENGIYADWNDDDSIQIGMVKITDFKNSIISQKYEILRDEVFKNAVQLLNNRNICDLKENEIDCLAKIFNIDKTKIQIEVKNHVMSDLTITPEIVELYIDDLLSCDKKRADIEKYDRKCLEDINKGHWELWTAEKLAAKDNEVLASLSKPLIARNPVEDIHFDGLIGIDFGTKSTIVSKQDGRKKITLLRVGIGQLNKTAAPHHYENPTIMEFIDIDKFIKDYKSKDGRPDTSVNDLRVSHTAYNDLKSCSVSDNFYSFFYDIKQWCGDNTRKVKIKDQTKSQNEIEKEWELPCFADLKQGDLNPLEIYAYYLGLYINNMHESNGIYLNYILSFPVTYKKEIKKKILDSFTAGLKKSLPESILNNEEIMSKFRVRQGVSEPAAYAITALKGYGFDRIDEDEKIMYAIFDFGGGTTDFDFGVWRCSDENKREEEDYDYVIEHFGSEGDAFLGGENLLELMAYEIFKANANLIQKGRNKKDETVSAAGFSFSKPKECDAFPGSETLISSSQEARRNTKQLMEVLRPFWEGIIGIEDAKSNEKVCEHKQKGEIEIYNGYIFNNTDNSFPIDNDGAITVDLFDKDGKRQAKQKLYVDNPNENIKVDLIKILENRIERGVQNFFYSLVCAFRNKAAVQSGVNEIQIFLAGNSSKSPILRKIFNEQIREFKINGVEKDCFKLYPPLGTDEAMKIQKEKGIKFDANDITAPTGKTGVAYGLIEGRESGAIKVISEISAEKETKFRYYIVIEKRGRFKMVLDRNMVDYGQWVRFGVARSDFEFYYSSLPGICEMSPDDTSVALKSCHVDNVDSDSDIYIRAVSPETIEYCIISKDSAPTDTTNGVTINLNE